MVSRAAPPLCLCFLLLVVFVLAAPRRKSASSCSGTGSSDHRRDRVARPFSPRLAHGVVKDLGAQSAVQPPEERRLDVVEGALEPLELLGGVLWVVLV